MKYNVSLTLAAAVVTGGTFTVGYPSGTTRGDFLRGKKHDLIALQSYLTCPKDFTISFGASNATVTYNGATTLPAGTAVRVGLDCPGQDPMTKFQLSPSEPIADRVQQVQGVWANLGAPAASNDAYFRANAALGAGGNITLLQTTLDVPRNIIITSAGNDSSLTFTVTGKDEYNNTVVEAITGANAGIAAGKKAFKTITTISSSGAAAGNLKIGFGNVLGLPIYLPNAANILKELLDGAAATAGTTVAGLAVTTKSTSTTADVRGTYVPNSAPDGTNSYALILALENPGFVGNPQFAG